MIHNTRVLAIAKVLIVCSISILSTAEAKEKFECPKEFDLPSAMSCLNIIPTGPINNQKELDDKFKGWQCCLDIYNNCKVNDVDFLVNNLECSRPGEMFGGGGLLGFDPVPFPAIKQILAFGPSILPRLKEEVQKKELNHLDVEILQYSIDHITDHNPMPPIEKGKAEGTRPMSKAEKGKQGVIPSPVPEPVRPPEPVKKAVPPPPPPEESFPIWPWLLLALVGAAVAVGAVVVLRREGKKGGKA